jgi:hypothetical protein
VDNMQEKNPEGYALFNIPHPIESEINEDADISEESLREIEIEIPLEKQEELSEIIFKAIKEASKRGEYDAVAKLSQEWRMLNGLNFAPANLKPGGLSINDARFR